MTPAESIAVNIEWNEGFAKLVDQIFSLIPSDQLPEKRDDDPLIELNNLAKVGKLDVTKVMVGAFQGTAGQRIVDEIYDMANTTNKLDVSFERAYRLLLKIDCHKYAREDGTILEYAPTWHRYHETFQQLITESKNIASAGKCYAERYAQEVPEKLEKLRKIIEDPRTEEETLEETRKRARKTMQLIEASINLLLKDMADTEARATKLGAKLSELSRGVTILSEELERDVDCLATTVDIDVAIQITEEHIKNVQTKLEKLKTQVSALFSVAAKELETAKENLEALKRKRDALAQSKTDVNAIQEEVTSIVTQLGTIMKIWSSIQSDAVQLKGWLRGCLNPDVPVEDVARDLSEIKIGLVYSILCQVLQIYATEVNVSTLNPLDT
ncbi:hypothetical protein EST38_g1794 [Candolleomyces aberdarensis]|uniref:Uncharacterized protein n=1 Tax=Candolleomyces aberdarensis TaxID=2316362 RepID=A0A4Q2DU52_9AGAR|nr:hypothetical protein EST38_g1794 [Candolleomyces aberdarensis]